MKKEVIGLIIGGIVIVGLVIVLGINIREAKVKVENVADKDVPRQIEAEIIPEYRDLERALAVRVDNEVYIVVTRGEKPTTGYEVEIDKVELECKDDTTKVIVYANFTDPENAENLAQVKTYPYAVAKTDLSGLPDKIELKSSYVE